MNPQTLYDTTPATLEALIYSGQAWLEHHNLTYSHGTDNALDEAAWLALEACDMSPVEPLDDYRISISAAQLEKARDWFRRRAKEKIPVAYLTGRSWFAGYEFAADERALIPRSPIAELILQSFSPWITQEPARALDLCCGGGCIAISIARQFSACHVDACDLSADALALAAENCRKHDLEHRVSLYQGDLFSGLPGGQCYELIVSNPPYVDQQDMQALAEEFTHEPGLGLAAGVDGLDIVARILAQASDYLSPDGVLIVEVGNSRAAVEQRFSSQPMVWLEFSHGGEGVFLVNASDL